MISEGDLLLCGSSIYLVTQVETSAVAYLIGPTGETVVLPLTEDGGLPEEYSKIDRASLGAFLEAIAEGKPGLLEMAECVSVTRDDPGAKLCQCGHVRRAHHEGETSECRYAYGADQAMCPCLKFVAA